MIKRISVKCMAAIMGAAAVMSPATAAMGIVIEADAINYDTTENITPNDNGERNLTSEDTLATNPAGKTIHNNAGTITTNNGTVVDNSEGTVEVNNGKVTGGDVGTNTSTGTAIDANVRENHGTVTASDGGSFSVEHNCSDGTVNGAGGNDTYVGTNDGTVSNVNRININNGIANNVASIGENNYQPPAPQPSGDSDGDDEPEQEPVLQPVDNAGGDSSSIGSLTVLPSETPTIQQEEKSFVNTLNSEMAKLADASASAASGLAGQQTINVNMGANNSYTSGMIAALETAADKNVEVAMTLQENGQHMTFTVPAGSDYSAVDSYFEQTGSKSEGYRMIQSLVSGSAIEDASGNKNVNTTDTGILKIKADADAIMYGIDYSATIVAGGGYHGPGNYSSNSNNPVAVRTAIGQNAESVAYGGAIAAQTGSEAAVAITSGGTATDTTVNGGGSLTLNIANTAMTAAVPSGGTLTISAVTGGGTATISAGTMGDIAMTAASTSGGTAIDTSVNVGGSLTTSGDISTSAIAINGGSQTEIGRIHAGGAVVATGTLPDTASQRGTFAVTDNRSVLIANAQGVFLASKGSIQKLE